MSEYFSHDYDAREDENMEVLEYEHGMLGYGTYWALIEIFYRRGGKISCTSVKPIAAKLNVELRIVESILDDYGLFRWDEEEQEYINDTVISRLEKREEKTRTLSENGKRGGRPKAIENQNESKRIEEEKQSESKCLAKANQSESKCFAEEKQTESKSKAKKSKEKEKVKYITPLHPKGCCPPLESEKPNAFQEFLDAHPSVQVDTCRIDEEYDFPLLAEKIRQSEYLRQITSLAWLLKQYPKIKSGYYDDHKKPKESKSMHFDVERKYTAEELRGVISKVDEIEI